MRHFMVVLLLAGLAAVVMAQGTATQPKSAPSATDQTPAVDKPDSTKLYNAALLDLGATAKGSGAPFNKDWPPNNTLVAGLGGGGTVFGGPLKGGRVDITLLIPLDIAAIEVVPLDYYGSMQPKAIDIFVDGKLEKQAELPETPGKPIRIPLAARGQKVGILVTADYPIRTLPDGKKGADYGGWSRLRVLSTTDLPNLMRPVDGYKVERKDANIAPTSGAAVSGKTEVIGTPRQTKGHPCTLWDKEDIAHYQAMLKTSSELQAQFAGLKQAMDVRITQPVGVPPPQKDAEGKWRHLSDLEPFGGRTIGATQTQLALDIANLGAIYALTGEAKYAEFAKQMLLAYADAYPNYGIGARPGIFANHDPSKVFDFRLGDAIWLIPLARGYDLIYNLPSITPAERKHIEDDLIKANAQHIAGNHAHLEAPTNWSAISTCAILAAGYATDDEELINMAFYGLKGTKEKPTGGLYLMHFGPKSMSADGLWSEGAMGYQFMALQALVYDAEMLWHHGVDMYRYRDAALKRIFDSPLQYAYPNLKTAAIHDSGYDSILGGDSYLYEYAYRRYRAPAYLTILNQAGRHLGATYQQYPVSILYDRDLSAKADAVECKSVNFFSVGYGILRQTTAAGTSSLLLDYGPNGSHGHPDKLNIDLYAFNERLVPDPGSVWYEQPIYWNWYRTSLAHNTLVVDELDQIMTGATQVVYAPASSMGLQRAWTADAVPAVIMDRALFLTPEYLADIFGAFTRLPRKMDLAWHIRGEFASDLKLEPKPFPAPVEKGYSALTNVRRAAPTDQAWSATLTREGHTARFFAAGGTPTEVIVGDGILGLEKPPTILERRQIASTLYGNVVDISDAKDGYVKSVRQEGGLEAGYGLLEVHTTRGADLCFASFRPGSYKAGGLETDALQAYVLRDGKNVRALYLGGGSKLVVDGVILQRSEPGLAYLERMDNGSYVLANPSPSEATVTITHPELVGLQAFALDNLGRRVGAAASTKGAGSAMQVTLKAVAQVEFAAAGVAGMYESRQAMLAKRQADQEAALAKARNACAERTAKAEAEAKAKPVPAGTIAVLNATQMSGQGGGTATISTTKRAAIGQALSNWDTEGHWLEWTFTVPAEGYYNLTICYCSENDKGARLIAVNGAEQEPFAPLLLPSTGGYANGSDDWRLGTAMNPVSGKPLLLKLKAGANTIRLTNANGVPDNLNYVAVTSPDVKVTRELLAAKMTPETP